MFKLLYRCAGPPLGMRTARLHGQGPPTWNTSLRAVPLCTLWAQQHSSFRS
jgi:hypothetical protein